MSCVTELEPAELTTSDGNLGTPPWGLRLRCTLTVDMGLGVGQRAWAAARRVPARALRHAQFTVGVETLHRYLARLQTFLLAAQINMLIGLCGGRHAPGKTGQRLTCPRNLRGEDVDRFIPHRGAWLQASPPSPYRCHTRCREVCFRRPRTVTVTVTASFCPFRPHLRRRRCLARIRHPQVERALGDHGYLGRLRGRCPAETAVLPTNQRRCSCQRKVAALQRPLCCQ